MLPLHPFRWCLGNGYLRMALGKNCDWSVYNVFKFLDILLTHFEYFLRSVQNMDILWTQFETLCRSVQNMDTFWTQAAQLNVFWTWIGHFLSKCVQKTSFGQSLDIFWTCFAKMCPKSVRPYIVLEHPPFAWGLILLFSGKEERDRSGEERG